MADMGSGKRISAREGVMMAEIIGTIATTEGVVETMMTADNTIAQMFVPQVSKRKEMLSW